LGNLASQEEATAWAQGALGVKNTLTTADAGLVEAAFAAKLAGFGDGGLNEERLPSHHDLRLAAIAGGTAAPAADQPGATPAQLAENELSKLVAAPMKRRGRRRVSAAPAPPENNDRSPLPSSGPEQRVNDAVAWHIDKSVLTLSEPRRYRDRAHLEFVSSQPCLVCGRRPSDAHHLRFAQPNALGRRVSDEFAVPLCRTHHRALHGRGDEAAWWTAVQLDPVIVARRLWRRSRLNEAPGQQNSGTSVSTTPLARNPVDGSGDPRVGASGEEPPIRRADP
jgi:hypothetical protein